MEHHKLQRIGNWALIKQLGSGGFGVVQLWRNTDSKQEVATKWLRQNNSMRDDEAAKLKERWTKEFDCVYNLKTPHIVRGVNIADKAFVEQLNARHDWAPLPVIIMEYCNGGDLREQLQQPGNCNGLSEYEVREVLYALRHAIEYLHTVCRIEHRDLKPDNIVIHQSGDKRSYKLTDFGFARGMADYTIQKSMVGTRHYFAPEVVSTAKYTHTVDYWSAGVIAFELMCGCMPFIPHQDLHNILINIEKKPHNCLAISEDLSEPNRFVCEAHVYPESRISRVFLRRMEEWLRLSMDTNYQTRGIVTPLVAAGELPAKQRSTGPIAFYTLLDDILNTKILRVFCLNNNRFYDYELTPNLRMDDWEAAVLRDTQLKTFEIIFPAGHALSERTHCTRPLDLYMADNSRSSQTLMTPMVYIFDYQCDYNAGESVAVTETIKTCMKLSPKAGRRPKWQLERFEQHIHFLLSSEQKHLRALVSGLHEFAMELENVLLDMQQPVEMLLFHASATVGRIQQFIIMVEAVLENSNTPNDEYFCRESRHRCDKFDKKSRDMRTTIDTIHKRHKSALQRAKQQATNSLFTELIEGDNYGVVSFQTRMKEKRSLGELQSSVVECLKKRSDFFTRSHFPKARDAVIEVSREYLKIRDDIQIEYRARNDMEAEVEYATREFLTRLLALAKSPIQSSTAQDGIENLYLNGSITPDPMDLIKENHQLWKILQPDENLTESCAAAVAPMSQ